MAKSDSRKSEPPPPAEFKEGGRTASLQVSAKPAEVAPADTPLDVPQALLDTPPAEGSSHSEPPADD